jgi:hypothetical protein
MKTLKKIINVAAEVAKEVALLKRPVTASALVGFVLVAAGVLGKHPSAEAVTGVLVGIGGVAATLEKILADVSKDV